MNTPHISLTIAGSTPSAVKCAQAVSQNTNIKISTVICPKPKPFGRKKVITENPMQLWAKKNNIPYILIDKKIDQKIQKKINKQEKPNFLLVVDFGYIIPTWMISWPQQHCINIHPSLLPRWRGSSPGQFSLLFADQNSGISLIEVNQKIDQGDIFFQIKFSINPNWNQINYYKYAFELITVQLDKLLIKLYHNQLKPQKQPFQSPTILARKLSKKDSHIEWQNVSKAMGLSQNTTDTSSSLIAAAQLKFNSWPKTIHQATKAFYQWPGLWTFVPTKKGKERMKIIETEIKKNKLILKKVQLAGKKVSSFEEIKNIIDFDSEL